MKALLLRERPGAEDRLDEVEVLKEWGTGPLHCIFAAPPDGPARWWTGSQFVIT